MSLQQIISQRLCEPLKNVGATDLVTGTDLRRCLDNLASVLADGPDGFPDEDIPSEREPEPPTDEAKSDAKQPEAESEPTTSESKPVADEPTAPPPPPPNPTGEENQDAKQPETQTGTGRPASVQVSSITTANPETQTGTGIPPEGAPK